MKVVELDEAATVTEAAGTGSSPLLLDSDTTVPPAGAALLSVTVHVVAAPEFKLVGLHASDDITIGATKLMVAVCETPLNVAVSVEL